MEDATVKVGKDDSFIRRHGPSKECSSHFTRHAHLHVDSTGASFCGTSHDYNRLGSHKRYQITLTTGMSHWGDLLVQTLLEEICECIITGSQERQPEPQRSTIGIRHRLATQLWIADTQWYGRNDDHEPHHSVVSHLQALLELRTRQYW